MSAKQALNDEQELVLIKSAITKGSTLLVPGLEKAFAEVAHSGM